MRVLGRSQSGLLWSTGTLAVREVHICRGWEGVSRFVHTRTKDEVTRRASPLGEIQLGYSGNVITFTFTPYPALYCLQWCNTPRHDTLTYCGENTINMHTSVLVSSPEF